MVESLNPLEQVLINIVSYGVAQIINSKFKKVIKSAVRPASFSLIDSSNQMDISFLKISTEKISRFDSITMKDTEGEKNKIT